MPAAAPKTNDNVTQQLAQLGASLTRARKAQRVSATAAAEAAGISRVTLHRIEKGESNVSMAAWAAAADALGLTLGLSNEQASSHFPQLPARVRIADYPQLKKLAWQLQGVEDLAPRDALQLYERNWRHIDKASLTLNEIGLIRTLAERFGAGELLV